MSNEQKLKEALENLVNKLEEIHKNEDYRSVWIMNHNRFGAYTGPTYTKEFEAANECLQDVSLSKS